MSTNADLAQRLEELEKLVRELTAAVDVLMEGPDVLQYRMASHDTLKDLERQAEMMLSQWSHYDVDEIRHWTGVFLGLTEREYSRLKVGEEPAWRTFYWLALLMMRFMESQPDLVSDVEAVATYRDLDQGRHQIRASALILLEAESDETLHQALVTILQPFADAADLDSYVMPHIKRRHRSGHKRRARAARKPEDSNANTSSTN